MLRRQGGESGKRDDYFESDRRRSQCCVRNWAERLNS
jgi:hypothetical protein